MRICIAKIMVVPAGLALLSTLDLPVSTAHAQGTAFTYQGRLNDGANPASGNYDFRFRLAVDPLGNNYYGTPFLTNGIAVSAGLFITAVDFGPGVFTGSNYWLEVDVRTNGAGGYTALTPLQALTATPYAVFANSANNLSSPLSGDVSGSQGATVIATVGGVTAVNVASGANAANAAATNSIANTIVKRDAAGGITASNLTVNGNLLLPPGTTNAGVIFSGTNTLIVNFGDGNFFAGAKAGNLAMTGAAGFSRNTALGDGTLATDLTGYMNTAVGFSALSNNFNGVYNTAAGALALQFNTSGSQNTAFGTFALQSNTVAVNNTAVGYQALYSTVNTANNTAVGFQSLANNTGGYENTAIGSEAMQFTVNGALNTAVGFTALYLNTSGSGNVAVGGGAMTHNSSGASNVGVGQSALFNNSIGSYNVGIGENALYGNTAGNYNTVAGANAMQTVSTANANTVLGYQALYNATGDGNIAIGFQAGYNVQTNGNNIEIGNLGLPGDGNVIRLGTPGTHTNAFIAGVISGNGGGLTNLNATQLVGIVPLQNLSGITSNQLDPATWLLATDKNGGNAATLNGLSATNFWQVGGNNVAPGQFIGSTNNQPVEIWVNGARALRLEISDPEFPDEASVVGGSISNYANEFSYGATIAGGGEPLNPNSVIGSFGAVGGGSHNQSGPGGVVGGGFGNHATNGYAAVCGGNENNASGNSAFIGGGGGNVASGDASVVGGGYGNVASGYASVVVGGGVFNRTNVALGDYSCVVGGAKNLASGNYSSVPGGSNNVAGGECSFAAGNGSRAASDGCFVWSDDTGVGALPQFDNQFVARASGGFQFFTATNFVGAQLASGSGSWSSLSDRNVKENFQSVDAQSVLQQVAAMPMTTWNYKTQAKTIRHIGPMAQDFSAAFHVGENDTTISTVDEGGVALAAIQGLNQKLGEKDAEIRSLQQQNEMLGKRLDNLEQMIRSITERN